MNAIRTSHNPPAPELLDLCDRLGLLVKDEAFRRIYPAKTKLVNRWLECRASPPTSVTPKIYLEWSVRDIQDMVLRDRNHPSIVMWSIGNEIDYANDPFSRPRAGR